MYLIFRYLKCCQKKYILMRRFKFRSSEVMPIT